MCLVVFHTHTQKECHSDKTEKTTHKKHITLTRLNKKQNKKNCNRATILCTFISYVNSSDDPWLLYISKVAVLSKKMHAFSAHET